MRVRGGPKEDLVSILDHDEVLRLTRDPGGVGEVPHGLLGDLPGQVENHRDGYWSSETQYIYIRLL